MNCTALAGAGLVALTASQAGTQVRLEGLERVYFERPAQGPPRHVASLLPGDLAAPEFTTRVSRPTELDGQMLVRDLEVALRRSEHRVWIREVSDSSHPRISDLWWALYEDGRRTDLWHFAAIPDRTDKKMLSNYLLESVAVTGNDLVVLRVRGEMFRPGGAWWIAGKEFVFKATRGRMALDRVRNTFGFFHSPGGDGVLAVTTEREVKGRFEVRQIDTVPDDRARTCGFQDPTLDDGWQFRWSLLETAARCLTEGSEAAVTYRDLHKASFIER